MNTNARDEQVRAVLLEAAKLIEENGWCQGASHKIVDDRDCYCITGAIGVIADLGTPEGATLRNRVVDAIRDHLGLRPTAYGLGNSVSRWNDAPERTQAEVVAALRGAAEGLGKERAE